MNRRIDRGLIITWAGRISLAFLIFAAPSLAPAQQRVESPAGPAAGSQGDLMERIDELSRVVQELRDEVARSRGETLDLQRDLRETRLMLKTIIGTVGEKRSSATAAAVSATGSSEGSAGISSQAEDRIEERLAHLEEDHKLLDGKVGDQYQTKVESSSRYRARLSGIALLNVFGNRGSVDNLDLPNVARPRNGLGASGAFGATVRQSMLGLEVFGPNLRGARTSAEVQFDFFGGFPDAIDGVTTGLVRLRTAAVHVDWKRTSLIAGQDIPFFSPLSPSSLASLAVPAFSYSGNLWTWAPQVRFEHRVSVSEASTFLFQWGMMDPLTGEPPYHQFYRRPQAGERSRQPAYATRFSWSGVAWGERISLGAGSYYARQNWGFGRTVDGWVGSADWSIPLSRWFLFSGEFYRGRALGGLGAATGRSALFNGGLDDPATSVLGLNTVGGWAQLKFKPTPKLEFNSAFGEDVPFSRDLNRFPNGLSYANSSLWRNQSGFINAIYRARSNLLFSAEYRRLWTSDTDSTKQTADHVNLSVGMLF